MTFIPALATVRMDMIYTFESGVQVNTFHFEKNSTVNENDLGDLIDAMVNWHATWLCQWQVPAYVLAKVRATDLTSPEAPGTEFIVSSGAGTDTAESPLPANCAAQIVWLTGLRGRSYRGRMFIGGIAETRVTGSSLDSTYKAGLATAAAQLLAIAEELTAYTPVVVSRQHDKSPRTEAYNAPITSYGISPYIVSQRRRLPGRGV